MLVARIADVLPGRDQALVTLLLVTWVWGADRFCCPSVSYSPFSGWPPRPPSHAVFPWLPAWGPHKCPTYGGGHGSPAHMSPRPPYPISLSPLGSSHSVAVPSSCPPGFHPHSPQKLTSLGSPSPCLLVPSPSHSACPGTCSSGWSSTGPP